jgi:hypothetical protein
MEVVSELGSHPERNLSLRTLTFEREVIGAIRKTVFGNCRDDS